jgi:hypothetical protein
VFTARYGMNIYIKFRLILGFKILSGQPQYWVSQVAVLLHIQICLPLPHTAADIFVI